MNLNERAVRCCRDLTAHRHQLRIECQQYDHGTICWDFGVRAEGGLQAGLTLARICLADLAQVQLTNEDPAVWRGAAVTVTTDHPVLACMGSQYAGWKIDHSGFFAIGSGPMRAAVGDEKLLEQLAIRETAAEAVGILEAGQLPPPSAVDWIAQQCGVPPQGLHLLIARTASQAGTVQVVARSIETALHKLFDLGFDLRRVASGFGTAPLPPVAGDDLAAIGRTNDAILYGGRVTLWVRGDDESLAAIAPQIPSSASHDFGSPFREIFAQANYDFYQIDPHLFSPAAIRLVNLDTGRSFEAGQPQPAILQASFEGGEAA